MGLFNVFKNQLAEVIQWENQQPEFLWFKYPGTLNEIKNASKLIVAPGQGCVLVYEGKVTDVIAAEGIYNLKTDNHPFVTTLQNLWQNFESEHKLFLYFYRRSEILNQPWGSAAPIKYVDAVYNIPVQLGINGTYSFLIKDIHFLYQAVIGSRDLFTAADVQSILLGRIPQIISQKLAAGKYSYQEIDAHLPEIAAEIKENLNQEYAKIGLELTDFSIVGTRFDAKTEDRIGRVAEISADIIAAEKAGMDYVALEKLRALRDAAKNEGGMAGAGLQIGVGMELGKAFNIGKVEALGAADDDVVKKLKKLKLLWEEEIISTDEYEMKRKELLAEL